MSTAKTTTWTTSGRQIMCSVNGDTAKPFFTQGVAYGPTPIGETSIPDPLGNQNSAIWGRDIPQIRAMGANSIRIYGMDATKRKNSLEALDACWNGGVDPIYVTLSLWINPTDTGIQDLATLKTQYEWIGKDYGNHPAVMGFSIGSEFNTPANIATTTFWTEFESLVTQVKAGITASSGTKLISTGFVDLVNEAGQEETIVQGEANGVGVDVWGIDVYRGDTFSNLWSQIKSATKKPFVITEFGVPASYHEATTGNPTGISCGTTLELPATGSPSMADVVSYMTSLWNEIELNSAVTKSTNISSGGYIFEWSDEWWKSPQCGGPDVHSGGSATNPTYPGGWDDEEWFGLNSIAAGQSGKPNVLTPRATYAYFKKTWKGHSAPAVGLPTKSATVTLTNAITNPASGRKVQFKYTSNFEDSTPTWELAVTIDAKGDPQSFTFPAGTNGILLLFEADGNWDEGCALNGNAITQVVNGSTIKGNWIAPGGTGSCPIA